MIVVKFGGSLIDKAREIMEVLKRYDVFIIPGGGVFADFVRSFYRKYKISEFSAHRMAILSMEQYAYYLRDVSGMSLTDRLEKRSKRIFLPYKFLKEEDPFEPSWSVTSDSIACYITYRLGEKFFIKLTDVDGVFYKNKLISKISAKKLKKLGKTCLDENFADCVEKYRVSCAVVNGLKADAVKKAMEGEYIGTVVYPSSK